MRISKQKPRWRRRLHQTSQDVAESVVFKRPLLDRKKKNKEGRHELKEIAKETIISTGLYANQTLRTLKVMRGLSGSGNRAGLDKRVVSYSTRHADVTYTMKKRKNAFVVSTSVGHADLKPMEPYHVRN